MNYLEDEESFFLMKIKVVAQAMTYCLLVALTLKLIAWWYVQANLDLRNPFFCFFITRFVWFNKDLFSESKNRSA